MNNYSSNKNINELQVLVNNKFIEQHIPDLTSTEKNLLMGFMGKAKRQTTQITVSYEEASDLANYKNYKPSRILETSKSLWSKVKSVDYSYCIQDKSDRILNEGSVMLFSAMNIDRENEVITFSINPFLLYFVNDFEKGNYTSFRFRDLIAIEDSYSKKLYTLLSQFNSTGFFIVKNEELRYLLDAPKSYSNSMFTTRIVNRSAEELLPYFKDLKVETIKKGKSNKIDSHKFTFKKQKVAPEWVEDKYKKKTKSSVKEVNPTYARQEDGDMSMEEYAHEVEKLFEN